MSVTNADGEGAESVEDEAKIPRVISLPLGPLIIAVIMFLPGIPSGPQKVLALLAFVIVWWITTPIPMEITALVGFGVATLLGIGTPMQISQWGSGHQALWVVVSALIIVEGMRKYGLTERWALYLMSRRWAGGSMYRLIAMFIISIASLTHIAPNVPVAAAGAGIGVGILKAQDIPNSSLLGSIVIIVSGVTAQFGGYGTPIGAVAPNFIMRSVISNVTGFEIGLFQWLAVGIPTVIVLTLVTIGVTWIYIHRLVQHDLSYSQEWIQNEYEKLGAKSQGEKNTLYVISILFIVWIGAEILQIQALSLYSISTVCVGLMFILPVDWEQRKFTIEFNDFGTPVFKLLLLTAFSLLLVGILGSDDIGFSAWLGANFETFGLNGSLLMGWVVALFGFIAQFVEGLPMLPIVMTLIAEVGTGLQTAPSMLAAGMAMMVGAILPISSIPLIAAYGVGQADGYGQVIHYVKFGLILSACLIFAIILFVYPWASFVWQYI